MLRFIAYSVITIFISFSCIAAPTVSSKNKIYQPGPYDFVYGEADAPIQILEYFSLTCPHCENFHTNIFPKLKKKYIDTGKVMWIKRSYITDLASDGGTLLLNCVDKSSYEAYLNILITKQASWAYQKNFIERLKSIAALGGMSAEKFDTCMNNDKLKKDLNAMARKAKRTLKLSGTPAFFMNKKRIDVYNYKSFTKHIDEALNSIDNK